MGWLQWADDAEAVGMAGIGEAPGGGAAAVGFLGLGIMGQPMALNLARARVPLVVWNRTPQRCAPVAAAGARVADGPRDVLASCRTVILMLADESAVDEVLGRDTERFGDVRGRTLVQMGTFRPAYSARLAADVHAAGGAYVEAPVSGSRGPAEDGRLVAMLAGPEEEVRRVRPVLDPMCSAVFECGQVPSALETKLAVNVFLITMATGLAESFHFAERHGIDPALLERILDAGPMASAVSRAKARKLTTGDFAPQAAIADVLKNSRLAAEAARERGVSAPLLEAAHALYAETRELGFGRSDMAAVVHALRARAAAPPDSAAPA
ncbi:NAD(P)-dependent oxidoreductase [Streptomonospora sp. S1-112]|uniref:NAD(P)-dependent oxidoreductase n=1 Tax=Streptomonospora mangrovi TaxID=2883123 RepID=A0A9X3NLZ5_9ACTN|nr:NAD(P)-dependent oxidoreductase [Streptomonospora mangrovi]MDA0564481.1 NAD(P)-dependent oxidoreductase [Streptomonospora mangrovi]